MGPISHHTMMPGARLPHLRQLHALNIGDPETFSYGGTTYHSSNPSIVYRDGEI